ncbi:MAG: hypothetical protein ACOYEV_03800 [Candidatus Nanopelagicales bacterium]
MTPDRPYDRQALEALWSARLQRERAARRECEDIAERALRDMHQHSAQVEALSRVARLANEHDDVATVCRLTLELLCQNGPGRSGTC